MNYQTIFISSSLEDTKRKNLLGGSRRFTFGEREWYYSYSKEICLLKERVLGSLYLINQTFNELDEVAKRQVESFYLLDEATSSCLIDGYKYSSRANNIYNQLRNKKIEERDYALKNISTVVGFSISSPFKEKVDILQALDGLQGLIEAKKEEDSLLYILIEHFLFEYIHPYIYGNGLIGRFRMSEEFKATPYSFLSIRISSYLNNDPKRYFMAFKETESHQNYGCLNPFIINLLTLISLGLAKDIEDLKKKINLYRKRLEEIEKMNLSKDESLILKAFGAMKIFKGKKLTISHIAFLINKSERTVFRHLTNLKVLE